MSAKLVLRVEWNVTVWTRRVPFDTKKFSNLSPEILVEWKAPLETGAKNEKSCAFDQPRKRYFFLFVSG